MKNKAFIFLLAIVGISVGLFMYFKKDAQPQGVSSTVGQSEVAPSSFRVVPIENSVLIKPHSPMKGPFSAKATLVEFLDPECEACAAMHPYVKKVAKEFEKDLRVVVRYMPFHKNSKYVANILEGARAQNKYWEALDLIFATQGQWANHNNPQTELIPEILKPLGLNLEKIIADAKSGKYDKQINEDLEDGKSIGVRGTPTFFVNGKALEQLGYESLQSTVEQAINRN